MKQECKGPRRNTSAYNALERLDQLVGKATRAQLAMAVLPYFRSKTRIQQLVLEPLLLVKFIRVDGDDITITPAGHAFISGTPLPESSEKLAVLAAMYRPPSQPLDVAKHVRMNEMRPGALDYRTIPSLMAGQRVPFGANSLGSEIDESVNVIA